ncbi:MAG: portal protein, partial [bacterium]
MANKNTVYQNLSKFFNINTYNTGNVDGKKKVLVKGDSVDDIKKKGLELQQRKDLEQKFFKNIDLGFQKALQYEAARLPAYLDYEGMEYYPIIGRALDLYMEESTNLNERGEILNIYSNNRRIKESLYDLFYNIVNVNTNLPFWVRNVCKYGDNFCHVIGEKKEGITNVRQLVNYDIERYEKVEDGKPIIRFKNRTTTDIYNVFEILHFRLLGDDKYMPYGSCLLSDSYVKTNDGYKEIKDICKGDQIISFDTDKQENVVSNVLDVVCNGKKQTYKISTQHNYIKATDNHKILTYDKDTHTFIYKFVSELKVNDNLIISNEDENKQTNESLYTGKQNENYIIESIKSIELDVVGDVYDIHVDNKNHNFYANNIVVHNSILNKVRRVFRQLIMAEDAMLTYRIVRAGDRRVYRIDVGNMDVEDIEEYIYKVATKFKKKQNIDPQDGQIDYRFNILGNDEDIFLPVRNGNTQTGVDTLEGMKTAEIHDIEYLRDNLFTGLGVPKPFLSFQDVAGDGKNMAQHDVRFAKRIIRVQQAILQEFNKLAVMHLYLQGFSKEDVYDFSLTLNNPSTQEETLKMDLLTTKANLYRDMTSADNGIAAISHTNAKKRLLNMSDDEIALDLKQQRLENAVMQELKDTP